MKDATVVLFEHPGKHRATRVERRHEIHFKDLPQIVSRNFVRLDVGLTGDSGTVHENIDPAESLADLIDDVRDVSFIR